MSRVDLVLVNPGDPAGVYQGLATDLTAIEPPVWVGLIASHVQAQGWTVEVIDANAERLSPLQVAARVAELHPVLTAVVVYGHQPSASTQNMPAGRAILQAIRDLGWSTSTILVGGHVAALPERTLREESADFVAAGEGLTTVVELLKVLRFQAHAPAHYQYVPGLVYWDGNSIRQSSPPPVVPKLDGLAVPWRLFPMDRYRAHNWHCLDGSPRQPYAALYTSLGCPYRCDFCCIQAPFKVTPETPHAYRMWSPEVVAMHIDHLVNQYGVRNIKFADEMFVLNRRHVEGVCDLLIGRGYDLNLWAYGRVDTIQDGMLDKLRRAGFRWLALGIESGNERVREASQKGFDSEVISKKVEQIRAAGINVIANYIFGLPHDTQETMQETFDLAQALNCEWANFYCAMAYPGSALYDRVRVAAPERLPARWGQYSQHAPDTQPLGTDTLTPAQVVAFRDQAFQTYFRDPHYQSSIYLKFGLAGLEAVNTMLGIQVTREAATVSLVS